MGLRESYRPLDHHQERQLGNACGHVFRWWRFPRCSAWRKVLFLSEWIEEGLPRTSVRGLTVVAVFLCLDAGAQAGQVAVVESNDLISPARVTPTVDFTALARASKFVAP